MSKRRRISAAQLDLFGARANRAPERPGPAATAPEARGSTASPGPAPERSAGRSGPPSAIRPEGTPKRRRRARAPAASKPATTGQRPAVTAPESPPESEPHPKTKRRAWPLTAAEAGRNTALAPLTYSGIVTFANRVVCTGCLNRDGAVKTLNGERFHHYLWQPGKGLGDPVVKSACATCGTLFEHERERVEVSA